MIKMLDISLDNPINIYSGIASIAAVQSTNENYQSLMISNHFNVAFYEEINAPGIDWANYDDSFGQYTRITEPIKKEGVVKVIKDCLDEGFYVKIVLDHYYIKQSDYYMKYHNFHDCALVYGYDDKNKMFFICDNFIYGKYVAEKIHYDIVQIARESIPDMDADKFTYLDDIVFSLDQSSIKRLINNYLEGKNTYHPNKKDQKHTIYGSAIYEKIKDVFFNYKVNDIYDVYDNLRITKLMENHYGIINILIEYCLNHSMLPNHSDMITIRKRIEQLTDKMRYLTRIYFLRARKNLSNYITQITEKIDEIKEDEKEILIWIRNSLD